MAVALVLLLVGAVGAQAATFTVNTTADLAPTAGECSGTSSCSLRQAIDASNATTTDDTITVPAGHYTLTIQGADENNDQTGDLDVNKASGTVTIAGAGARSTTIDATGLGDRVLQVVAGTATISGFTITGGTTPTDEEGGGIENDATVTVTDTTFTGNHATGTSIRGGDGGGIANPDATSMTLVGDTFSNNVADAYGGGIDIDSGTASITNTTITGNSAPSSGGGVDIDTGLPVQFTNDTISGNSTNENAPYGGGGVYVHGPNVSFLNTIVANNTGSPGADCQNRPTDQGHNLDSSGSCFTAGSNGDITSNPVLGPLQNNGGQTDTRALLDGSPAINAGDNTGCPASDQRGVTRPQGPACDIGAYEATPPFVQTTAASGVTETSGTLNGTVNPDNLATTYHFEYGLTSAYGSTTLTQSAGSDYAVHSESAAISGLSPGTTYHYRIVATNAIGTSDGVDVTFTTAAVPRLSLSVSPHRTVAGKRVCYAFKATSSGHGVSGVQIRFAGRTTHTSSFGAARICAKLSRAGTYTAHASKSGYRSATARVTVKAKAKATAKPKPKPKPKATFTG